MTVRIDATIPLTVNGEQSVTLGVASNVIIGQQKYTGAYDVTPSEEVQTLETQGLRMLDDVTVEAIPADYVGSGITRRDADDITASGATVTVPAGYYSSQATKSVDSYTGPYEYTPTEDTQTVAISDKMATENIVINPIPYNYGLVTWNGSILTVS